MTTNHEKNSLKIVEIEQNPALKKEIALTPWLNNPYLKAATSENTRIAYQSDIRHFERWGGRLPAHPEMIAHYLQQYATSLNTRTLARRLTALKHWHTYQGFSDPTQHPAIQKTMTGITRLHGKPKAKAQPLLLNDLLCIAKQLQWDETLPALRDNALLQIGYFGALRRSELVAICVEHIEWKIEGIDILLPHSKTDQLHEGQWVGIPFGKSPLCPVTALKQWLEQSNIKIGPIFREIKKNALIQPAALSPLSVNLILKKRAETSGISYANQLSGHSLRRGLATSASLAGANLASIMRQGRWKQLDTIMEYIDASNRFTDNVADKLLKQIDSTS